MRTEPGADSEVLELSPHEIDVRWRRHASTLDALMARILKFGRVMNLVGARDAHSLAVHVREALACVLAVETAFGGTLGADEPWLDVGSGGGLPGLVVAAATDCPLVLVEPRAKRASFLEASLAVLGRQRARVVRGRVSRGAWDPSMAVPNDVPGPGEYAVAGARAVVAPELWAKWGASWVRDGGLVAFHLQADVSDAMGFAGGQSEALRLRSVASCADWRLQVAQRVSRETS